MLQQDFVLGWMNNRREPYVGASHGYTKKDSCIGTTNGAGPRNVQIFVLSPDLVVLHALPGFWHPEDLARELWFAKELYALWCDGSKTRQAKDAMFARMQLAELRNHPKTTYARSTWQGFDARSERGRLRGGARDTILITEDGRLAIGNSGRMKMKPINVLVHERMSRRPFVAFADFDIESFVDYGRPYYDNNASVDGTGRKLHAKPGKKSRRLR